MPEPSPKRDYTPEEYLVLEEAAEYKSEYRNGEIVPRTGGTTNHNQVVGNFSAHLYFAFRRQNYRVFMNDVRLWTTRYKFYTYPDIMVIEGEPNYYENRVDTVTNPQIIVEVLSKSTKNYDRGDKFDCYRSIPEFKEYILIDQYKFHVEQFSKTSEGKWLLSNYESAEAVLTLSSVDFTVALSDIYERVDFELRED